MLSLDCIASHCTAAACHATQSIAPQSRAPRCTAEKRIIPRRLNFYTQTLMRHAFTHIKLGALLAALFVAFIVIVGCADSSDTGKLQGEQAGVVAHVDTAKRNVVAIKHDGLTPRQDARADDAVDELDLARIGITNAMDEADKIGKTIEKQRNELRSIRESRRYRWGGYCEWVFRAAITYLLWITLAPIAMTLLSAVFPGACGIFSGIAKFSQLTNVFRAGNGIAKMLPGQAVL